jgi:hypothetical protein
MAQYWKAPAYWPNSTFFIVGGGPSLKGMDLSGLEGKRVIAVNNAYQLVRRADALFFCDARWWRWHRDEIGPNFPGRIITAAAARTFEDGRVLRMARDYTDGVYLSKDPLAVCGVDSGYMAMNLAYHFGASRIVLLGFDMGFTAGEAHWHPDHEVPSDEGNYLNLFAPRYPGLCAALKDAGVEVIRCTPSRLSFIPEVPLEQALALPDRQRR